MTRVWITGSTGFVGGNLLRQWRQEKAKALDIVLFVRSRPAEPMDGVRYVVPANPYGEFGPEELRRVRDESPPDLIVHLATRFQNAYSTNDADAMIDANVRFPTRLLEACRELPKLAFLNFGTFYSHAKGTDDSPMTFYAATKRAFESFLNFYFDRTGWRAITLKLFDTYGASDTRAKLIPKWMEILDSGEEMKLSPGAQKLNLVHIDDVLSAIDVAVKMLLEGKAESGHRVYQLPAAEDPASLPSVKDASEIFESAAGRKLPLRFGALPYRDKEIMSPRLECPVLPGWKPQMTLLEGFRGILGKR